MSEIIGEGMGGKMKLAPSSTETNPNSGSVH